MLVYVDLEDLFTYSILRVIIILILFILINIPLIMYIIKKGKKQNVFVPSYISFTSVKNRYLQQIDKLQNNFINNKISKRKAYQELSSIIRHFVFEVTGIKVHTKTLEEIKSLNIPYLKELIEEFYLPEFSLLTGKDIKKSIEKTRKVVELWH